MAGKGTKKKNDAKNKPQLPDDQGFGGYFGLAISKINKRKQAMEKQLKQLEK